MSNLERPPDAAAVAAEHADLGLPVPRGTRLRFLKRLIARFGRLVIHHQVAYNHAMLASLEQLRASVDQLRPRDAAAEAPVGNEIRALRSDLHPVHEAAVESLTDAAVADRVAETIYAEPRVVERLEDCHFYTSMDIPGVGSVEGEWDLRQGVDDYLGHVDFAGKRVLEIGPASGFLTFTMEQRGAEVVSVEIGDWRNYEFIPRPNLKLEELESPPDQWLGPLTNGFWFAHRAFRSSSRIHYGTGYDLPDELGTFDISMMGAVLLHNRDPLKIVHNCAQRTREKVIVADLRDPAMAGPVATLLPSVDNDTIDMWWRFTPEFFAQYLGVLGFPRSDVTFHEQPWCGKVQQWFTIVASR